MIRNVQSVHTLDNQIRAEDTHGRNTDTGLCGTVSSTETGEDDGGCAPHGTEEGLRSKVSRAHPKVCPCHGVALNLHNPRVASEELTAYTGL